MITGQILVYRYNGLYNAKVGVNRNHFTLENINVQTKDEFQSHIADSLDHFPPGKGYVLVKWNGRVFICEKDINHPKIPYVRHEVKYHPLLYAFTI